jgi:type II secretion system protein J
MLEILIAVTILTIIIVAIYSSWTAILRASKAGRDLSAAVQRSRIAIRVLEDSLTSAQSFVANQPYYGFLAENGSEPMLSFVARLSKSFPRSGKFGDLDVRRVTFSVEDEQLVLRQVPLVMEPDIDEKEHPIILAKHVKDFELKMWDPRANDWVEDWRQTNQIPRMVMFTLRIADNERLSQPNQEINRIISIPSVAVQPVWQAPRVTGVPPGAVPPGGGAGAVTPPGSAVPGRGVPGTPGATLPGSTFNSPGRVSPR